MIVTVTPNASLDLSYSLPGELRLAGSDDVHRATSATVEASGKGVNVSRALSLAGEPTIALLPVGGATGAHLLDLLEKDGVPHRYVGTRSPTRINTTVLGGGGATTKVNAPGGTLSATEADALIHLVTRTLAEVVSAVRRGEVWLAICGSLPPGVDPPLIRRLVAVAHDHGVPCVVDSSGEALREGAAAGADLIAPNEQELGLLSPEVLAARGNGIEELARAVAQFVVAGGCRVLLSMGAEGALWSDGTVALHAAGPVVLPVNTAGAGDALLAGWLSSGGAASAAPGPAAAERLARAVSWGAAACLAATTVFPGPPRSRGEVQVHSLPITDPRSRAAPLTGT